MSGDDAITLCVWPDGCWCEHDELPQMSHKSDDYVILNVPASYEEWEIDAAVQDLVAM